jgi:hypothetical protein
MSLVAAESVPAATDSAACTTIVIDGFPGTQKEKVARLVAGHLGLSEASVRYDVPSAVAFEGGLLEHCSLPSVLEIHKRFTEARSSSRSNRGLRRPKRFLIRVRDSWSTLLHTRAHLALVRYPEVLDRPPVRSIFLEPLKSSSDGRTLRYFLASPEKQAEEALLKTCGESRRKLLRPKAMAFVKALSIEFLRITSGNSCNSGGGDHDYSPYTDFKLVETGNYRGAMEWAAWQIKQDVARELNLDCYVRNSYWHDFWHDFRLRTSYDLVRE